MSLELVTIPGFVSPSEALALTSVVDICILCGDDGFRHMKGHDEFVKQEQERTEKTEKEASRGSVFCSLCCLLFDFSPHLFPFG